jgi:hypothetical protein
MDGDSSWRARTQVFQDVEYACVFRHVVGHGAALADEAVLLQEDGTVTISDHHPERSSSPGIHRFASSIEPSKVLIALSASCRWGGKREGESGTEGWVMGRAKDLAGRVVVTAHVSICLLQAGLKCE